MSTRSLDMEAEIGSFEAKAKLSQLLREVERGQRYTITVRGRPVADLVPHWGAGSADARGAVEAMRALKK
ncbi:MAG: type II toxin-antitoxin system Phd/YefM family antitoxin, partial [Wenzhouxiangella sp.]